MKNKELILYVIFGVLTTLINIVAFQFFCKVCSIYVANGLAWISSVLFAYVTNRKYVFESKEENTIVECIKFIGSRLTTGIVDMICMYLLIDICHWNTLVSKILVNGIVIVLNYVLSKLFVFQKGR